MFSLHFIIQFNIIIIYFPLLLFKSSFTFWFYFVLYKNFSFWYVFFNTLFSHFWFLNSYYCYFILILLILLMYNKNLSVVFIWPWCKQLHVVRLACNTIYIKSLKQKQKNFACMILLIIILKFRFFCSSVRKLILQTVSFFIILLFSNFSHFLISNFSFVLFLL